MKLITYQFHGQEEVGLLIDGDLFSLRLMDMSLPLTMEQLLNGGSSMMDRIREVEVRLKNGEVTGEIGLKARRNFDEIKILAPVPRPTSFRDAYAFRQHVETSRANRGLGMIPEFDQFPVYYFSNHRAILGPGNLYCMPNHLELLDFELEVAVVLNKQGRNISASEADDYIAGYMILNDFSARAIQMEEMKLNLGPAKGKDFATALGPWLVTPDEIAEYEIEPMKGHQGRVFNLNMFCRVNGVEVSRGNLADMHWTFAEIIERASYGVDLFPGDLIGSGTVGTGCFLELNGTGRKQNIPGFEDQWLKVGDKVELEVTGLGLLTNFVHSEF